MIVGVVKETSAGERRIAVTPAVVPSLKKTGLEVVVEAGAGLGAGFDDEEYQSRGATIVADRSEVFGKSDLLCQIRAVANQADLAVMRPGLTLVGLADPLGNPHSIQKIAQTGARLFALELLPRITRAQSMDVLSSQANIAGYKAVLIAAESLPRMFPMMMTAAGTIPPVKVFVIGAGVAGLQAIATAKRLGAAVQAYDIRAAVREQIESLGAKFVHIHMEMSATEDKGGYAKAMDDAFYQKQREFMASVVQHSDVVITTAAVPGAKPPVLVTADMVKSMPAGSVIVDLASKVGQVGGNCDLTKPDQTIDVGGVTIHGPTNLPATVPQTASQMYAKNIAAFVTHLIKDGQLTLNMDDEITGETLACDNGEVVNPRLRKALNLEPMAPAAA